MENQLEDVKFRESMERRNLLGHKVPICTKYSYYSGG